MIVCLIVESGNQGNPEEFQSLHTKYQWLEKTLQDMQNGEEGLSQQQKHISNIINQVKY